MPTSAERQLKFFSRLSKIPLWAKGLQKALSRTVTYFPEKRHETC
jgi:hypothetical protein